MSVFINFWHFISAMIPNKSWAGLIPFAFMKKQGGSAKDLLFKNTTLLINGDGINGGTNNTFIDGSVNNLTLTKNGTLAQGSFSPYGNSWSVYFPGAGNYLTTSYTAFGTGNYTLEFYFMPSHTSAVYQGVVDLRSAVASDSGISIFQYQDALQVYGNGLKASITTAVTPGNWYHIALVRNSSTVTLYKNGVGSASFVSSINHTSNVAQIGTGQNTSEVFTGSISNVRVVSGTAVYTSDFSPSTIPLTAISGTSLLICQSYCFKDSSAQNFTVTSTGSSVVQRWSPFPLNYLASTHGGSAYFNGLSTYMDITTGGVPTALNLGSSDFSLEFWIYPQTTGDTQMAYNNLYDGSGSGHMWVIINHNYSTGSTISLGLAGTNYFFGSYSNKMPLNQWTHILFSRVGTSLKCFKNGTQLGTTQTIPASFAGNLGNQLRLGATTDIHYCFTGYYSDLRIVKGSTVSNVDFTPPSAPLSAVTNTALLCNFTNASLVNLMGQSNFESVGTCQISTSVKKYGTGSIALGSGSCLQTTVDMSLPNDYTIECWCYITDTSAGYKRIFHTLNTPTNFMYVYTNGLNVIGYGSDIGGLSPIGSYGAGNTWFHLAITRVGTSGRVFINGTQTYTFTANNSTNFTGFMLGDNVSEPMYGYLDDFRVTKGVARYTANFTPPTQSLSTSG